MIHSLFNRLRHFLGQQFTSMIIAWGYCRKSSLASVITVMVIGLALALPMGLLMMLHQVEKMSGHIEKSYALTVFLSTQSNSDEIQQVRSQLLSHPDIADVEYISPADGLKQFQQQSGFRDALRYLPENPLPPAFIIYPLPKQQNANEIKRLADELSGDPRVDLVQYDMQWLERLFAMMHLGRQVAWILLLSFALGVILVTGHTIRLTTQNLRQEIEVIYLLGGTREYIRRPFLYAGVFYGGLGAITAWVFIQCVNAIIAQPVNHLLAVYDISLTVDSEWLAALMALLITGMLLGILGSRLAVQRELKTLS